MAESVLKADFTVFDVYTGFWINWSHGQVKGATLTVDKATGGFLIAFLALYVSATGQSLWRLACFFIHRKLSSLEREDALYHQRQAILRNSESPHNGALTILCTAYCWRNIARRPWLRLVPLFVLALVLSVAITLAGVFSSQVSTQNESSEVLLKGSRCGVVTSNATGDTLAYELYLQDHIAAYQNYALQCYSNDHASMSENCRYFVKPKLPYTVDRNASCPFAEQLCKLKDGNIVMDTGFLDSHYDMGLNAPPKHRFKIRNRVACAPLVTEGRSEYFLDEENPALSTMRYFYGNASIEGLYTRGNSSFTFQVPANFSTDRMKDYTLFQGSTPDYYVGTQFWNPQSTGGFFDPLPELFQDKDGSLPDRNLDLFFLSAPGVVYQYEVDDPWFSAHVPSNFSSMFDTDYNGTPLFTRDEPAGVIACTSQVQYCNPNLSGDGGCENLTSYETSYYNGSQTLFPDTDRLSMGWAKNISIGSIGINLGLPYQTAGSAVLQARAGLRVGMQNDALPANQWQLEMEHLYRTSIASYQFVFAETANGPLTDAISEFVIPPVDKPSLSMCRNQKIISSRYYSFNVLGMVAILAIGTAIILLDYTIEHIVNFIDKRWRKFNHESTYARLEWAANSTLQLQRLAHEELGLGTWRHCADAIPVTEPGEKLGLLDVTDEEHPILIRPGRWRPGAAMRSATGDSRRGLIREDSEFTLTEVSRSSTMDKKWSPVVKTHPASPLRDW
ncbi:uncharacterized protein EI97DRAFT_442849 [Westerdykella ornata]|uniref:Uncharacterized protein n=1 Tax=Westerdykella ornata TaxID=318751 RepID=A0A6A6JH20_WESOR|nr:uncharacterized protein EI97DRAFT_442849 [Westerdykella ornata]KAF2275861.1 hypothetical protein EI97DRAFT_442849 [Westerdykella ornata]